MEKQPDSAISGQDAHGAGLDAGGQEAGRLNGMMSLVGKRTSERDDAIAERDRLRAELEALQADSTGNGYDGPGSLSDAAALLASPDEADEAPGTGEQPQGRVSEAPPPEYELPVGSVVTTPDGSQYLVREGRAGNIAPTSPSRSTAHASTELDQLRQQFAAELPGYVAEMQDRALLGGN